MIRVKSIDIVYDQLVINQSFYEEAYSVNIPMTTALQSFVQTSPYLTVHRAAKEFITNFSIPCKESISQNVQYIVNDPDDFVCLLEAEKLDHIIVVNTNRLLVLDKPKDLHYIYAKGDGGACVFNLLTGDILTDTVEDAYEVYLCAKQEVEHVIRKEDR